MNNKISFELMRFMTAVNPIEDNPYLSESFDVIKGYAMWVCNLAIVGMIIYGLAMLAIGRSNQQQSKYDNGITWIFRAIALGVVEIVAITLLTMFGIFS